MSEKQELEEMARRIIDSNLYMTLATSDETGRPWVSPVYFATYEFTEFIWVSSPEARHSRNLSVRQEMSIVIFDSRIPVNKGQAVYMSAEGERVPDGEVDRAIAIFSERSARHGAGTWTRGDVEEEARLRVYRALASEHFVLDAGDRRIPVSLK